MRSSTVARIRVQRPLWLLVGIGIASTSTASAGLRLEVEQITSGPKHHFFGYIGHAGTIPWDATGRFIVALQVDFQDHMPGPDEPADVILIDTERDNAIRVVDRTLAWNFQQGTMLAWNPRAPETQFFFNDRDPETGRIFCVLFDIEGEGRRVREYRSAEAPVGNSGVARRGGSFLALNYGRLARLRPVTGYPGAFDWTRSVDHPADDGIFRVDVETGERRLIVSYARLAEALRDDRPGVDGKALFINHTLWNRDDDRIFFYARADFDAKPRRVDALFVVDPDGADLRRIPVHLGGHLDWGLGHSLLGARDGRLALFDTDRMEFVGEIGDPATLPNPDGDKAFSPDGKWLVDGSRRGSVNHYVFFRPSDATVLRSPGFDQHGWTSGDLRIDPAPCWNRAGTRIVFPSIDAAGQTRQLFLIRIVEDGAGVTGRP